MTQRILYAAVLALPAIGGNVPCRGDTGDLTEQILQAWQEREDVCHSFVAEWTEVTTLPTGSISRSRGFGLDRPVIPSKETVGRVKFKLVCDGNRVKLTRRGVEFELLDGSEVEKSVTKAFDGKILREVIEHANDDGHPGGWQYENGLFDDGDDWRVLAAIATFRPASPNMGAPKIDLQRVKPGKIMVGNVECHVIDYPRGGKSIDRFYVATTPDFRLIRREHPGKEYPSYQLTIDYEPHATLGYVCNSWSFVKRDWNGDIQERRDVRRMTVSVNEPVDPKELEFKFAPGTVLTTQVGATGVIRRDGTLRIVSKEEIGPETKWSDFMEPGK